MSKSRREAGAQVSPLENHEQSTVFAGHGTGQLCAHCQQPILASEIEYEVPAHDQAAGSESQREIVRVHLRCHEPWRATRRR